VVTNQARGHVHHVPGERKTSSLASFYDTLTEGQNAGLESITTDMWPAYIKAALGQIPEAQSKTTFDKFHLAKYLGFFTKRFIAVSLFRPVGSSRKN
jgi:transposase